MQAVRCHASLHLTIMGSQSVLLEFCVLSNLSVKPVNPDKICYC